MYSDNVSVPSIYMYWVIEKLLPILKFLEFISLL